MSKSKNPTKDLKRILDSAKRMGVELDEEEALQWLSAMAAQDGAGGMVHDARTGVFGHKVSMLDFSPDDLEHFRKIGRLVEFADQPGRIETALALSGSAAQSKIQTYPGDCDFFERVNIIAPSKMEACHILAEIMRTKVIDTLKGPTYQLIEVKFGSYPVDTVKNGELQRKGTPISWIATEVVAGQFEGFSPEGQPIVVRWDEV